MWLVKEARLLLPLTDVMKIDRLTSPLLDAPRQLSPKAVIAKNQKSKLTFKLKH